MSRIGDFIASPLQKIFKASPVATTATSSDLDAARVDGEGESVPDVSPLARQLAAAAERAAQRDSQLSRPELAKLGMRIRDDLNSSVHGLNKPLNDAFVPDTDDAELLARARQATEFVNGKGQNPFKDLSTEQLVLIGYDEEGDFTKNEREAAFMEIGHRYSLWTHYIVDKSNAEYEKTGLIDDSIREVIAYYKALPAIEEAQFGNYEINLNMLIGRKESPPGEEADSLQEKILKTVRKLEDEARHAKPALAPAGDQDNRA
ncbi:hypothetical protein [Pseudomonas juntendi]|uniref:hypothetical protein n=1 Tax=Pseudomonas juntendi TaxID=2666183 RepID=UPI001E4E6D07|nr:hypothetical protein [Pseudomonas juntendi]MDM3894134.1 hypothetical protein [Pseudomonas juntendi]